MFRGIALRTLEKEELCRLTAEFARAGVVRIREFLPEELASRLHHNLHNRGDWLKLINDDEGIFEFDRLAQRGWSADQRLALENRIYSNARTGFQFRFESIRVPDSPDDRARSTDLLARIAEQLSSPRALEYFRAITGSAEIAFADLQATAYAPGDFLTGHDDEILGKNRIAAYTLGMTPQWRLEWGGLLVMHDCEQMARAFGPGMNILTIFKVPAMHSVSEVTQAAAHRRYMLTGWLRAGG